MNRLLEAAHRASRQGPFPTPFANRQTQAERLAAKLSATPVLPRKDPETWDAFLRRIGMTGPENNG